MQFSTVDTDSWLELGSVNNIDLGAFPVSEDEFSMDSTLSVNANKLAFHSRVNVRHRFEHTFGKAGGLIAAGPKSEFAKQAVKFFYFAYR